MERETSMTTLLEEARLVEKRKAINNSSNDVPVYIKPQQDSDPYEYSQYVKKIYQQHAHKVEANSNCSLCTVAPFYGTNVTALKAKLTNEGEEELDEIEQMRAQRPDPDITSFFARYGNPELFHSLKLTPEQQMLGMNKALKEIGINLTKKINFKSDGSKKISDLEEEFQQIQDNQGIICFWYSYDKEVSHYLYGQKVNGRVEFIDFQLDKGDGEFPKVTPFPTFYSFSRDKSLCMEDVLKEKTPVEATFLIYDKIAPTNIQQRIELFRKKQIQQLEDDEPRQRRNAMTPDEGRKIMSDFKSYLEQCAKDEDIDPECKKIGKTL